MPRARRAAARDASRRGAAGRRSCPALDRWTGCTDPDADDLVAGNFGIGDELLDAVVDEGHHAFGVIGLGRAHPRMGDDPAYEVEHDEGHHRGVEGHADREHARAIQPKQRARLADAGSFLAGLDDELLVEQPARDVRHGLRRQADISTSSTRLRPSGARLMASKTTDRLKPPMRGRFVPRRAVATSPMPPPTLSSSGRWRNDTRRAQGSGRDGCALGMRPDSAVRGSVLWCT